MNEKRQGIALMLACASLWSTAGLVLKYIPWNALVIAGTRALFAGLTVAAYLLLRRQRLVVNRRTLLSGAAMCATCTLFVVANKLTTAANAIVLQYTAPVFLLLYSALFLHRRFRRADVLAVAFTLGGIALFFFDQLDVGHLLGNFLAMGAGASMGLMFLLIGDAAPAERFSSILLSEIFTVAIGLPAAFVARTQFTAVPVLLAAALGVFQLGIPYILYALAAAKCPPLACSLLAALEPLLNPLWVLLFYGERPGAFALAGGAVVIAAISLWCVYDGRKAAAARA